MILRCIKLNQNYWNNPEIIKHNMQKTLPHRYYTDAADLFKEGGKERQGALFLFPKQSAKNSQKSGFFH